AKDTGSILNRIAEKNIKHFVNSASLVEFEGYKVYAVNATSGLRSEVGHRLAEKTGTFSMVYYYDALDKFWKISLRSVKDFDVSVIAEKYGGGGHKNAAGFIYQSQFPLPFVKEIEEK
ncbi:MAG: DHHA1 domain-containing protein, partial [Candidatus Pacebacteria bacterium]|nr:DHHA1 domain-containing protein [Candidatus Paceibacterota bacterium]